MDHGHMHHGGDMGDMEPMCQMSVSINTFGYHLYFTFLLEDFI